MLNAGSQRVFVSVTAPSPKTPDASASPAQVRPFSPLDLQASESVSHAEDTYISSLELCRRLTQYMRGDLEVSSEAGLGTYSVFSAPFTIEHLQTRNEIDLANDQTTSQAMGEETPKRSPVASAEPFDRSYLEALLNEGIDLGAFMRSWRQSVDDDLQHMRALRVKRDIDATRAVLHRLSGAVGLVGAHSLMDALRCASAKLPEFTGHTFDEVEKLIAALMMRLDQVIEPYGSNLQ